MAEEQAPVVLYVAGSGRSGSTLLASAVAALPGCVGAGEVRYVWERGAVADHLCGCGEPFSACPVWTQVMADVRAEHPHLAEPGALAALAARQRQRLRVRTLPRVLVRRALGRLPVPPSEDDAVLVTLYRSLARVTGSGVVVDPSKLPPYGLLLQQLRGPGAGPALDVRVLHLVRDPRATAWSWRRRRRTHDVPGVDALMPRPGVLRASVLWALWNGLAALWWRPRAGAGVLRVRYEDLVLDPAGVLADAARLVGADPAAGPVLSTGDDGAATLVLPRSHTVAGNPDRHGSGAVVVRADDEWRTRMGWRARLLVGVVTAPARLVLRW
ncbi:sulfotransferase [Pseudokineococcus sp. 1T1Z-3]|uniref:sulfotransferase n=1 Tax=Pseudokineococcus sp. 1T1Z-3 TaxID=3132745 RepID=UPI00309CEB3D